jgi:hypothetical protein
MVTTDRGAILHHAGLHSLSPALLDGAPVLVGHGEAGQRCGWEPFFRAMGERGLVADLGPDGSARFVPAR